VTITTLRFILRAVDFGLLRSEHHSCGAVYICVLRDVTVHCTLILPALRYYVLRFRLFATFYSTFVFICLLLPDDDDVASASASDGPSSGVSAETLTVGIDSVDGGSGVICRPSAAAWRRRRGAAAW